ncbi:MAG: insulinase family protein [Holosporaceae bacterium]|jgi:predicted Zn-dependent peptidase|nr:insulinase family protein [Holosporaceae bacterium]
MSVTKSSKLDNGIQVVTKSLDGFESTAIGYWVDAGGVCEDVTNSGVSHFLEHMAFKGTTSRTALQIAEEIESVGGYLNAYTSKEVTAYFAKVLGNDQKLALDMLADILQNPTFLLEELEKERGVVLQELYQVRDTPDDIVFDHFQSVCFGDQSIGFPIVGYEEVVSELTADDLRQYRDKYYTADGIILAAAGNVSHEQLLDMAGENLGAFSAKASPDHDEQYRYIGGAHADIRELEQVHSIVGFEGVANLDPDYYTMAIFTSILGGGMSSRLFREAREKRGLCYSIYAFSSSYTKNGVFGVYTATTADKLGELADVVANEIVKMKDGISEKEFQITKAQFRASLLMSGENSNTSCEQMASQMRVFGRLISNEEILAKIDRITPEDVMKLTNRILASQSSTVTVGRCLCTAVTRQLQKNGIKV